MRSQASLQKAHSQAQLGNEVTNCVSLADICDALSFLTPHPGGDIIQGKLFFSSGGLMKFYQSRDYSTVDAFLRNWLSLIEMLNEPVWNAFKQVCGNEALARRAITWGRSPTVKIGGVEAGTNGKYRGRAGGPKHTVFINTRVAEVYENRETIRRADILESTVLHEMVHWARYVGGLPRLYNGNEAGKEFEKLAYGSDISCGCYPP
jgi:Metallopeptidase toxin 3